jgi:hypothetical protein
MAHASTPKELGEALRSNESTIEIEGDLVKKVIRIRATGNVAWAVALVALVGAVGLAIAAIPTGGATLVAEAGFVPAAAAVLGGPAAIAAISIAVAAGGVGALTKVRQYKEVKRSDGLLVLERR